MPDRNGTRAIVIRGWIVSYAALIHVVWAIALWFEPDVLSVGPIAKLAEWTDGNARLCSMIFFFAGVLAWFGGYKLKRTLLGALLGVPQLFLILIGAESCLEIIFEGVHPDGTANDRIFFAAQLAGSILLAPVYMLAVYVPYWKALWRTRTFL